MTEIIIPGSVVGAGALFFGIVRYALHGYRQARAEFVPQKECELRHRVVDGTLARAVQDIAVEAKARHDLRDDLQPIALKVASLEASMQGIRDTVSETRDLVKALVERGGR